MEQMLMSELETVQTVHHIELAISTTAEYTFKSMQSLANNWWFHSLKSHTCFLDFDLLSTQGAAGVTKFGKGS